MFSTFLRTALIALVATAAAVSAAPGLSLKVTGPDAVDGVENMKVVTTLTNTGDETLKLLNDPNGVLNTLPANTFTITTDDGASPSFTGVRVKYSPGHAAKSTDSTAFTVLAPGKTVSITHNIASAYNFTNTGYTTYTVEASNLFHLVNVDNEISEIRANTEPYVAKLTGGKLAVAGPALVKHANFNGCSADEQSALTAAASDAADYAAAAWSYLASYNTDMPRYTTWFGLYDPVRHDTVLTHFRNIAGNDFAAFSYDCTCTDPTVFSYVYFDHFGAIYLCGVFWDAPATGTDSKAGQFIELASLFTANGGSKDYVAAYFDPSGAQALAQNYPNEAVFNAENHEYFAENNPAQE